jgi:hypothetical protein
MLAKGAHLVYFGSSTLDVEVGVSQTHQRAQEAEIKENRDESVANEERKVSWNVPQERKVHVACICLRRTRQEIGVSICTFVPVKLVLRTRPRTTRREK